MVLKTVSFLSCFENRLGPESQKIKKKIFKRNGLCITVECKLIVTKFLDVNFNLKSTTICIESQTISYYCI